jgi:ATP phosphoribosyltransferase regulatory subunit HisZ
LEERGANVTNRVSQVLQVLKQLSKEVASSGFQAVRPEMFQPYILQKSNNIYQHRKTAFASFSSKNIEDLAKRIQIKSLFR